VSAKSVLITGPSGRGAVWADAARAAGWEPHVCELLDIKIHAIPAPRPRPDWVVVASKNALHALEPLRAALRGVRCACVGRPSAAALERMGLVAGIPHAVDAADLLARLTPLLSPGIRILAPRGSRSDELARALAALGAHVDAPIAYTSHTRVQTAPLPHADAVFFASASGVAAWCEHRLRGGAPVGPPSAGLALGRSTRRELDRRCTLEPGLFDPILELPRPEPNDLCALLRHLLTLP